MGAPAQETGALSRAAASKQLTEVRTRFRDWEAQMVEKGFEVEATHFKRNFMDFIGGEESEVAGGEKEDKETRDDRELGLLDYLAVGQVPFEVILDFIKGYVDMARQSRPKLRKTNGEEWRDLAEELNEFVIMLGLLPIEFGSDETDVIEISTTQHPTNMVVAKGA